MPWTIPPRVLAHPTANLAWRQEPCQGQTCCGDGVLVEVDRPDGSLLLLLLDVMGHGNPAAETVGFVRKTLSQPALEDLDPADLLTLLHSRLQPHWLDTERHVEAVALQIDGSAAVRGCCAGGLRYLWYGRPGGPWDRAEVAGALFLGVPHEEPYAEADLPSVRDAWLLLTTDGVTEAGLPGSQFKDRSFQAFLIGLPPRLPPRDLVDALLEAVRLHAPDNWPTDDLTALVLTEKMSFPPLEPLGRTEQEGSESE